MELKKSLGQNFFINENLGNQIISYISTESCPYVVEIGPGAGFFTMKLKNLGKELLVIEKDDILAQKLNNEEINVINTDFLNWDFEELENKEVIFFGSLPYNVSKPIISKIISSEHFTNNCYFIIQKEVAQKYIAKAPDSNLLSLKSQIYANCKKILDIGPSSFKPAPKVNSSLVMFSPTRNKISANISSFESFLEECFTHPRKTLRNNLKGLKFNNNFEKLLQKRPQHLSLEEYLQLFNDKSTVLV
mgnify:CR=1 FL=1